MKVIIMGAGRVGSGLALRMESEGHNVTVIDISTRNILRFLPEFKGTTLVGDGLDEDVLRKAGIETADAFCALTQGDNRNIMAGQIAKTIFNVKKVIARMYDPSREEVFRELGLETFCPTPIDVNTVHSLLEK
jgi:trk system potassium uptake protein TrkA